MTFSYMDAFTHYKFCYIIYIYVDNENTTQKMHHMSINGLILEAYTYGKIVHFSTQKCQQLKKPFFKLHKIQPLSKYSYVSVFQLPVWVFFISVQMSHPLPCLNNISAYFISYFCRDACK